MSAIVRLLFFLVKIQFVIVKRLLTSRDKVAHFAYTRNSISAVAAPQDAGHIPVDFPTYGGDGYGIVGENILIGGEGGGGGSISETSEHRTVAGGGYGTGNIGYMIELGHLRIYPLIGIGWGSLRIATFEKTAVQPGKAAANPKAPMGSGSGGVLLNIGLGIEWRTRGRFGPIVGIRLGYLENLIALDWHDSTVSGYKRARMPYIRLLVGGGLFGR